MFMFLPGLLLLTKTIKNVFIKMCQNVLFIKKIVKIKPFRILF